MWNYTEKVMDHFLHPRNVGEIENPDAVGEVGNITCGDALKLFLKVDDERQTIVDVRFQTFGCASAIASASALTELIKGKPIAEAEDITNQNIADFLGELPEEKMHCSVMGMEALQAALANLRGEGDGKVTAGDHDDDHYDPQGLDRVVCYCFSVTERKIREVVKANDLHTVEDVTHYCKAAGGCGGCRDEIADIIAAVRGEADAGTAADGQSEAGSPKPMTNLQKIMKIQVAIDAEIAPALKADGGDLELVDVDGNTVSVRLKGACAGCPSAHITLQRWVQAKLQELVSPDITVVEG